MGAKTKLAIMGASKWQVPICVKAHEMGIETHCFAYEEGAIAKEYVDYFYPISLTEKEKILSICTEINVNGVTTCASDYATKVSCWIAEKMGLNTTSHKTISNIYDKAWVRGKTQKLKTIKQPKYISGPLFDIKPNVYPCIVKPVNGNGKRGVWYVNNLEEFSNIKRIAQYNPGENALIEQYIVGKEFSVESLSFHGYHYVVQVTEKVSDGAPHFVELAHHQPANITTNTRNCIEITIKDILDAVEFTNGASHVEIKVSDNGDIYLIDLNPRGGGDYISTHLINLSTNCDYCQEIINIALNRFDSKKYPFKTVAHSGVYFLTKQTERLLHYFKQDIPCITDKCYCEELTVSTSNNDRCGYMIYKDSKKLIL